MSSKRFLSVTLALAFIFQETFGGHFVFLTLLGWLLVQPTRQIPWAAFFSGLILDLFSNAPFGVNSALFLIFTLIGFFFSKKGVLTIRTVYLAPFVFLVTGFYNTFLDLLWRGKVSFSFSFRGGAISLFLLIFILKGLSWAKERIVFKESLQLDFGL